MTNDEIEKKTEQRMRIEDEHSARLIMHESLRALSSAAEASERSVLIWRAAVEALALVRKKA